MAAVERPADRSARRHQGVVAADDVVQREGGVGECCAERHPEAVGRARPVRGDPARIVERRGAVVLGRDRREVRRHDAGEKVREPGAPLALVAPAAIGALAVGRGGERARAAFRAALAGDLVAGEVPRGPAHLTDDRALVADQPFVVDHVGPGVAVGDDAVDEAAPGRGPVGAVAEMRRGGKDAMGGEHPGLGCAGPDHILAEERPVGELGERRHGRRDRALVADGDASRHPHHDVGRVVTAEGGEAAILPDLPGDAEDVVGKVAELGVEADHRGQPSGTRAEPRTTSGPAMRILRGRVSPSMRESSVSTVAATMRPSGWRTVVRS